MAKKKKYKYSHGGPTDPPTNSFMQQNQEYITQLQIQAAAGSEMAIQQLQSLGQESRIPDADFSAGMAEYMPVTGEISDAIYTADALSEGNYGDAALYGAGFMLPFVPGKAIKEGFKNFTKRFRKTPEITPDQKTLLEVNKFSPNTNVGIGNVSYSTVPDVSYHELLSDSFTGDAHLFMNELSRGAQPFSERIASRVKELSTPRGMERLKNLYAPSLPVSLNSHHASAKASKRLHELENSTTYNKLAEDYSKTNAISNNSIKDTQFLTKSLFNNAAFFPKGKTNYRPDIDPSQLKLNLSDKMGMGVSYVDDVSAMDHEINHFLQQGDKTILDAELSQLTPRGDLGIADPAGGMYDYFKTGSGGMEPTSFAAGLRSTLLDKGFMKYADDGYFEDVTSDQLKKAYKELSANPAYREINKVHPIKRSAFPTITSSQRIFDFIEPTQENFDLLSKSLNKLPAVVPGMLGVKYAKNIMTNESPEGSLKYGGQVRSYQNGGPTDPPVSESQGAYNMLADRAADMMLRKHTFNPFVKEDLGYFSLSPMNTGPTFQKRHPELAEKFGIKGRGNFEVFPYLKQEYPLEPISAEPISTERNMELIDTRPKTPPVVKQPTPIEQPTPVKPPLGKRPQSYPPTPYRGITPHPPTGAKKILSLTPRKNTSAGIIDNIKSFFIEDKIYEPQNYYTEEEYKKLYPKLNSAKENLDFAVETYVPEWFRGPDGQLVDGIRQAISGEWNGILTKPYEDEVQRLYSEYPELKEAKENYLNVSDSLTVFNNDFGRIGRDIVDYYGGVKQAPKDKRATHNMITQEDKKKLAAYKGYSPNTIKNLTDKDYKKIARELDFEDMDTLYEYGHNESLTKYFTSLEEAVRGMNNPKIVGNPSDYRSKYAEQLINKYNPINKDQQPGMLESVQDFFGFKYGGTMNNIKKFKYGGKSMDVDYEAEGGEVVVGNIAVNKAYNGGKARQYKGANMYMLEGPSHEEGGIGIKMNTPSDNSMNYMAMGGSDAASYVFTDKIKVGGKGKATYADQVAKFGNQLDEVTSMAMGGDKYDRNTAKLMKPRLMSKVSDLFDAQEQFKKENNIDQNPMQAAEGGMLNNIFGKAAAATGLSAPMAALQFLPAAMNIGKGLFGKAPELDYEPIMPQMQEYEDFTGLQDSYLANQDRSMAGLRAGLQGSGATGSQLRAGFQAGLSGNQAGSNQFFSQLGQMQQQSNRQTDQFNIGQQMQADQSNQQMQMMNDQFMAQNDPSQAFTQGLDQLVGTVSAMGKQGIQNKLMQQLFGNFGGEGNNTNSGFRIKSLAELR